ncbi:MAG: transposase [Candidatus Zixiibacteriota bacterium]
MANIDSNRSILNGYGEIVDFTWYDLPHHNENIELDEFIIMPNHIHGIIRIKKNCPKPLSEIVRQFKTFSAKRINKKRKMIGVSVWQRNYYERIIRNQKELDKFRKYIKNNPINWTEDEYFGSDID